jgi:hypothetical protein
MFSATARGEPLERLKSVSPGYASIFVGVLLAVAGSSCGRYRAEARQDFSRMSACPPDRVSVAVEHGRVYAPKSPSPAVANDTERFADWKKHTMVIARELTHRTYFVARGCGHETTFRCVDETDGLRCTATQPEDPDADLGATPD